MRCSHTFLKHSLLILVIMACYIVTVRPGIDTDINMVQKAMLLSMLMVGGIIVIGERYLKLGDEKLLIFLIAAGMIMRIGYMIYTPCNVRSHDMYDILVGGQGHAGYILQIVLNKQLPQTNEFQMYQQPLFYILGGIVSKIASLFLNKEEIYYLVDATKILSCYASCATLLVFRKICTEVNLKREATVGAMILAAFLPATYLIGGRVNCDALVTFFMTAALLYTLRWYKERTWKNILILSIIYGLGVMTKISMGIMAIVTAVVFLVVFIQEIKKKATLQIIKKYGVFALISLPLGLWYSVRNFLLFDQSLTYVLKVRTQELYCGMYSFFQRFVSFDIQNLMKTPYTSVFDDYNLPVYMIKSSLFGEFSFEVIKYVPWILLALNVAIAIILAVSIIHLILKKQPDAQFGILLGAFGLIYLSSIFFNIQNPYGCSMDYRYYVILGIIGAAFVGKLVESVKNKIIKVGLFTVITLFGIFSCAMYLFIS